MNEAGLVANVLWLVESSYPKYDGKTPGLSIAAWAQYMLDNFAAVQEAVDAPAKEPFTIVTDNVPGEDRLATSTSRSRMPTAIARSSNTSMAGRSFTTATPIR
jgi:penicillin V acylase-like amidase (Ntn superfamily)